MSTAAPLPSFQSNVSLAPFTTLEVGGPARYWLETDHIDELRAGVRWAKGHGVPLLFVGGGSNMLVSDRGFDGLAIRYTRQNISVETGPDARTMVRSSAGTPWDALVEATVSKDLGGLECLSGIPGHVGACPIQNIGAYGQEVADTIVAVHVVDLENDRLETFSADECAFGYRQSRFKRDWRGRFFIHQVDFELTRGGRPTLRFGALQQAFAGASPSLIDLRDTVLEIRASKGMVHRPSEENRRSAGSFFMNPIVPSAQAQALVQSWKESHDEPVPHWQVDDQFIKLSAAWLIERAGFSRGFVKGAAGLSSKHTLALINRGEARAEDIIRLAAHVRAGVQQKFGVRLSPEPNFVGFDIGNSPVADDVLDAYDQSEVH